MSRGEILSTYGYTQGDCLTSRNRVLLAEPQIKVVWISKLKKSTLPKESQIMFPQLSQNQRTLVRILSTLATLIGVLALYLLGQPRTVFADTPVCGQITTDTVWNSSGNDYIVTCNVQVMSGVQLTIQPGTVVKFDLDTSLIVDGELVAQGVTFTSNRPTPADGDWIRILFNPTSVDAVFDAQGNYVGGSIIQDSLLEFGGRSPATGVIEISLASPFIYQNTIRNIYSGTDAINATGRSPSQVARIIGNYIGPDSASGDGITITNGQAMSNTISNIGGTGIIANNSIVNGNFVSNNNRGVIATGSTLISNHISGNSGTGLFATSSMITNNTVNGNSMNSVGCGGISAKGNSVVTGNTVSNNAANSNNAGSGGGICTDGGTVSDNYLSGNSSFASGGGIYAVGATVINNVVTNNNAVNGGGVYSQNSSLNGNTIINNNAAGKGGGIYLFGGSATSNIVDQNMAPAGGGIYSTFLSPMTSVTNNTITRNNANNGGGIYASKSSLTGNTVLTNTAQIDGGGLYIEGGISESNWVAYNSVPSFGHGSGVYLLGDVEFTYNNVITNTASSGTAGGITIDGQPFMLQFNNVYGNQPYDGEVVSSDPVDATLNYWGQSPCTAISGQVYDGDDVPGKGELTYAPSLYIPVFLTQFETPTGLVMTKDNATTITLSWNGISPVPNIGCRDPQSSVPDSGYYVYYETASACAFDGTGLPQGDSPIHIGQDTAVTLTGLSTFNTYHFVVTAYDYLGRESPFSNDVIRPATGFQLFLPLLVDK